MFHSAMNPFLGWWQRPIGPSGYVRRGRSATTRTVVVCAGDSITHGLVSANYVTKLDDRLRGRGYAFVNAGVTSDLAWNLGQRLDEIVACQPDVVTILIGTNDAAAQIDASWRRGYVKAQHLPQDPSLPWFAEELEAIVRRLRADTTARIALLTIPPLGEDLDSRHNALVAQVNGLIDAVGTAQGVPVLLLHDRLVEALPASRPFAEFDGTKRLIYRSLFQHFVLRRSWDEIVRRHGRTLLTDDLHLGDTAAQIVARVLEDHLLL
jgi:lysophospholipase L1-like esterase